MDNCLDIQSAISCESSISTIISNCKSHPNELLACNDTRFAKYASLLKTAQEIEEQRIQAARNRRTTKPIQTQISRVYGKWRQYNDMLNNFLFFIFLLLGGKLLQTVVTILCVTCIDSYFSISELKMHSCLTVAPLGQNQTLTH